MGDTCTSGCTASGISPRAGLTFNHIKLHLHAAGRDGLTLIRAHRFSGETYLHLHLLLSPFPAILQAGLSDKCCGICPLYSGIHKEEIA